MVNKKFKEDSGGKSPDCSTDLMRHRHRPRIRTLASVDLLHYGEVGRTFDSTQGDRPARMRLLTLVGILWAVCGFLGTLSFALMPVVWTTRPEPGTSPSPEKSAGVTQDLSASAPEPSPLPPPIDPEVTAASSRRMAENLLERNPTAAVKRLRDTIEQYPDAAAAREAREILNRRRS